MMHAIEDGMLIPESMAPELFVTVYEPTTSGVGNQVTAARGQTERQ